MTFQVLVKMSPHMQGSYSFTMEDEAAARAFVQRSDVWWYLFGDGESWDWKKGGAWSATDEDRRDMDLAADLMNADALKQLAEEDDDDDRW